MEKLGRGRSTSSFPRSRAAEKKGFLAKTVERCRFLGRRLPPAPASAPVGCFPVVVGPERERFFVRAERASHPLFRALLDEAEAAYGFPGPPAAAGPLVLPCAAEEFRRVMAEVERDEEEVDDVARSASSAPRSPAAWRFFSKGDAARAGYLKMIIPEPHA
ncbi:unnamed protein product [Urochloa decumbens]|uniref:Uncharacterized protein n=1 Tax=Urochloa decumbens TaxID=240449 RepID=A0ABC9CG59_9POAL